MYDFLAESARRTLLGALIVAAFVFWLGSGWHPELALLSLLLVGSWYAYLVR